MPRPSTRSLSEATRETYAEIVARQTAALTRREHAHSGLVAAQQRRAETTAALDAEVEQARRVVTEADAELVALFGVEQASELTGTPALALAKLARSSRS